MPELPYIEATCTYLRDAGLEGLTIRAVDIFWANVIQQLTVGELAKKLLGRQVQALYRRGKFIVVMLDGGALVFHLRMTGRLEIGAVPTSRNLKASVVFVLSDDREFRFIDTRRMGQMWLLEDPRLLFGHLGPEPLSDGFTPWGTGTSFGGP